MNNRYTFTLTFGYYIIERTTRHDKPVVLLATQDETHARREYERLTAKWQPRKAVSVA